MAWIESHDELPTHPKTLRAARRLKVNTPTVVGHLHFLWYWCLTHAPDGRLEGMDADDVADAAGWDDDGELFVQVLLQSGWLDDDGGTLVVHDWWDGAGKTIKRRRYATERQKRARESQKEDAEVTDVSQREDAEQDDESPASHADVTRDTHVSHGADSDSDSDRDIKPSPEGGDKPPFPTKLSQELQTEGWEPPPPGTPTHEAFQQLLAGALERRPEQEHHSITMGLIAGFLARSHVGLTREARDHTGRLVAKYPARDVLAAWNEAVDWGAGLGDEHAESPTSMSRYATRVLTANQQGAA